MRPPPSPPSGPRSMIQSACFITSRWCSMMRTVLPRETRRWRTSRSLRTSSKCRPVVGSSRMYRVRPVWRLESSRFRIVAAAAADFAGDVYIGEKIHFDAAQAIALAGFAAPAFYVEAEAAGAVAAFAGFGEHGEKLANGGEDAGVGGGIGARGAADGGLVDLDDFVDLIGADDFAMGAGRLLRAIEFLR